MSANSFPPLAFLKFCVILVHYGYQQNYGLFSRRKAYYLSMEGIHNQSYPQGVSCFVLRIYSKAFPEVLKAVWVPKISQIFFLKYSDLTQEGCCKEHEVLLLVLFSLNKKS